MDSSAGALQVAKIWKLPAELLTKICELCSLDDVVNLSQTSSVLRYQCERLLRSERFWETVVPWRGRYFFDSDQEELFTFDRATFLEQEPVSDRTFSFLKARDDISRAMALDLRDSTTPGGSHVARSTQVLCWHFVQEHTSAFTIRRHRPCYETGVCCCACPEEDLDTIAYRAYSQIKADRNRGCCSRSDRRQGQPPTLDAARDVDMLTPVGVRWNEDYLIWKRKRDRNKVAKGSWDWPFLECDNSLKLHIRSKGLLLGTLPSPTPTF